MKSLFVIVALLSVIKLNAQSHYKDTLYLSDGKKIICGIRSVSDTKVYYYVMGSAGNLVKGKVNKADVIRKGEFLPSNIAPKPISAVTAEEPVQESDKKLGKKMIFEAGQDLRRHNRLILAASICYTASALIGAAGILPVSIAFAGAGAVMSIAATVQIGNAGKHLEEYSKTL